MTAEIDESLVGAKWTVAYNGQDWPGPVDRRLRMETDDGRIFELRSVRFYETSPRDFLLRAVARVRAYRMDDDGIWIEQNDRVRRSLELAAWPEWSPDDVG